jgi:hypothetical protein
VLATVLARAEDSNSEMSWQIIPLKGRKDFQGSSRILTTETVEEFGEQGIWCGDWFAAANPVSVVAHPACLE